MLWGVLVADRRILLLARNTLWLGAGTCAVALLPAGLLAWLVARTDVPGRRMWTGLVIIAMFVPLCVYAAAWQAGFGLEGWFTVDSPAARWLVGMTGAIWVHATAAFPWLVLIVAAGFRQSEPELEELALLDHSQPAVACAVTLRRALPCVALAALWTMLCVSGEMTVTDLFLVRTFAEEVYTEFAVEPGEIPLGVLPATAVVAWLVVAAIGVVSGATPAAVRAVARAPRVVPLGSWRWPAAIFCGLILAVVIGVPLVNLLWKAGVAVEATSLGRVRTWSLSKTAAILARSLWSNRRELGWSLGVATLAATSASLVSAVMAAYARRGAARTAWVAIVAAVLLAIPGPVLGILVIMGFNQPALPWLLDLYDRTVAPVWLAQTLRVLPVVLLITWLAARSIPDSLVDLARLDGFSRFGAGMWLLWGTRREVLVAGWLAGVALCVGELAATCLVCPPGIQPVSVLIFGKLHTGYEDDVAGICLVLVGLVGVLVLAGSSFIWRRQLAMNVQTMEHGVFGS